jgi:hypothetical protein
MSLGASKHTSESEPQSLSLSQDRQCAGLCGMQYPSAEPGIMASQKYASPGPQSDCFMHGATQTEPVPMTTGLHSPEAQFASVMQSEPSPRPCGPAPAPADVLLDPFALVALPLPIAAFPPAPVDDDVPELDDP